MSQNYNYDDDVGDEKVDDGVADDVDDGVADDVDDGVANLEGGVVDASKPIVSQRELVTTDL